MTLKKISDSGSEATFAKRFFNFEYMITTAVLKSSFLICFCGITVFAIFYACNYMDMAKEFSLESRIFMAITGWFVAVLIGRLFFETIILFWKMHETLENISKKG